MNWKYHIPHMWDDDRQVWEDFYLLPCHPNYSGESFWLTILALGDGSERFLIRGETFERKLKELEGKAYIINGTDMVVRGMGFSKVEFLKWVKVWLEENGFDVEELVEAPLEDFAGTNQHAREVAKALQMKEELESLDPAEREKRLFPWDSVDFIKKLDDEQKQN
jgi:hypothetical protein